MSTSKRTVLVVGGGGREHALARRLAACPSVGAVLVAPGNAGTGAPIRPSGAGRPDERAPCRNLPVPATDVPGVVAAARDERADLVVVGPEAPLCAGLADALGRAGIAVFGPTAAAARLEGSKAFMKRFCARHGIPTARFEVVDDPSAAAAVVAARPEMLVVKADGLCAGKGVVVAGDAGEAVGAARWMLSGEPFGAAGRPVVIEERLDGVEASVLAVCDGERFAVLPAAEDHKRLADGDRGPNTGGMGAFGPSGAVSADLEARIARTILQPALRGMASEGTPFRGTLYAGVMIGEGGEARLLEFNVRFGDPETEVLVELLDGDLADVLAAAAAGRLDPASLVRNRRHALCVVLAAAGYPGTPRAGDPVEGLDDAERVEGAHVLHAGTRLEGARIVSAGGRVLVVTGVGDTLASARERAYDAAGRIRFEGMQMRRDIGLPRFRSSRPPPTPRV